MTPRTVRRGAFAAILAIASCSVYDSSLLVGGAGAGSVGGGGASGNGGSGISGTENEDGGAGSSGSAGTQNNGGSSGSEGVSGSSTGGTENAGGEPPAMGGDAGTGNDGGAGSGSGGTNTGGTGGVGGSGGVAGGSAGTAGSGGTSATGCAKLSVPLDSTSDHAHFVITLNTNQDLSTGTIVLRFYVQAGIGGSILPYVQDPSNNFFNKPAIELSTYSGWSTLTWDVGGQAAAGGIAKNNIRRIGVELTGYPSTAWSTPATVVYLDSITVKTTSFPFDATGSVSTTASTTDQSNQVFWLNNSGSDTTASGVTLSWQATCP